MAEPEMKPRRRASKKQGKPARARRAAEPVSVALEVAVVAEKGDDRAEPKVTAPRKRRVRELMEQEAREAQARAEELAAEALVDAVSAQTAAEEAASAAIDAQIAAGEAGEVAEALAKAYAEPELADRSEPIAAPGMHASAPAVDATTPVMGEAPDPNLRQELIHQLDALIQRVRALAPGYTPPPFSAQGLLKMLEENVGSMAPGLQLGILDKLKQAVGGDLFDVDTWKGTWYMLNYAKDYQVGILKRRVTGDYETDEWGLDRDFLNTVMPFFEFMYKQYWRVEMTGLENVPPEGRALLVSNHSGQLPWDGTMLATGLLLNHPTQRLVRTLYANWFPTVPIISDLLVKCGGVVATEENGMRLLEQNELVSVFPEGYKGAGKLYKDRYRLARFGRGGFVKMALKTSAPLLPVAVVGAEETYVSFTKSSLIAKLVGMPYFPISLTWPWLGLAGFIPLPTKWYIDIGAPIPTDSYGPGAADNIMVVSQLTDQIRNQVQDMLHARLAKRRSVFMG